MRAGNATRCDVAIIGAGAAGLAAMRALEGQGFRTCVLEARHRIGGRIHTIRDPSAAHPIELGAEFIHGSAPELYQIIRDARLLSTLIEGERWRKRGERLTPIDDFWKRLHQVFRRLRATNPDRSFAEFLAEGRGGRGAADARALARQFVEGFHAADAERISANALADGGSPSEDPDEQRLARMADGYDRVPEWLALDLGDRIKPGTVVERVEWERGAVEVTARDGRSATSALVAARALIVTVPLGVLLASPGELGAIAFSPRLSILDETRRRLTMGAVIRVTLRFGERWWTERLTAAPRGAALESLGFLHGGAGDIRVWWSLYPAYLPVLVGWAGGPAAARLTGLSPDELRDRALSSLAVNFAVSRRRVASRLEGFWTHDWQEDPLSRGAYSHALVGGAKWASRLARSIDGTIWIAGEGADPEGRNGTVHGAIASGRRAARSIARALK
jgi:monoamine oxidase